MQESKRRQPNVNFRPLVFCALGAVAGIGFFLRCRSGGFRATDLLFFALLFGCSLRPVSLKRTAEIFCCFFLCACAGAALAHAYTQSYLSGKEAGEYTVTGTVVETAVKNGYSEAYLSALSLDGERAKGKMAIEIGFEGLRAGDLVTFTAYVDRNPLSADNSYEFLFVGNVRYRAAVKIYSVTGKTQNPFLRLKAALYDGLHCNMESNAADVCYALLTGNTGGMDGELLGAVRKGGIAHIFAVSGLHVGILYGAVSLACRRLKKYRCVPASAAAFLYSAFCGFSVSSLRAAVMCAVLGLHGAVGRKYDFLNGISFAAIAVLAVNPSQWLSAGFRLSFGACIGLALFAGSFSRMTKKLPAFLSRYLSANLAVQLFTFPVAFEMFGYYSVWGTLLNFFLIPVLPALFLGLLLCAALALCAPPAAAVFLAVPEGMTSLLIYVFSVADFSLVLTGFSLGAGGFVWTVACVALSERVRFRPLVKGIAAIVFALLFALSVALENLPFGVRLDVRDGAVLIRTKRESVLVIDDAVSLSKCEDFLARTYGGTLSAVVVLAEDEMKAINTAAFLGAEAVYAPYEIETGLRETQVIFGETFACGELFFRFESGSKLSLVAQGAVAEIDFKGTFALGADLSIQNADAGLIFYIKNGIIHSR